MIYVYLAIIAVILIFLIPFHINGRFSFNLFEKTAALGLLLFKIKIVHDQFWLEDGRIIMMSNKKMKKKELSFDGEEVYFFQVLLGQLKDKIQLTSLRVFYNVGLDDAFYSAMVAGSINATLISFFTSIKHIKPTASFGVYDSVSYNRKIFQIAINLKVSISLYDIVYSLINSVILTKKALKKQQKEGVNV